MEPCRPMPSGRMALAAALVSLGLAACAGDVPPPTAQMGASSQAILNAERAGAAEYAPTEMQLARSKMAAADAAMRADNRTEARRLAEQAQADAELAAARAQNAMAQQAAGTVRRDMNALNGTSPEPFGATGTGPGAAGGETVTPPPAIDYRGPTTWNPSGIQRVPQ